MKMTLQKNGRAPRLHVASLLVSCAVTRIRLSSIQSLGDWKKNLSPRVTVITLNCVGNNPQILSTIRCCSEWNRDRRSTYHFVTEWQCIRKELICESQVTLTLLPRRQSASVIPFGPDLNILDSSPLTMTSLFLSELLLEDLISRAQSRHLNSKEVIEQRRICMQHNRR